jgi:hypothetical protein
VNLSEVKRCYGIHRHDQAWEEAREILSELVRLSRKGPQTPEDIDLVKFCVDLVVLTLRVSGLSRSVPPGFDK